MSLIESLDALLAFVDAWVEAPGDYDASSNVRRPPPFDVSRFETLDREVHLEARELGLQDDLPQPDRDAFNNPQDISFVGKTNLAGLWMMGGKFHPMPTRQWRADLLTLRALASRTEPEPPRGGEPGDTEEQMRRVALAVGDDNAARIIEIAQRKDRSGDEKMQELILLDKRLIGKDSGEWGTLLGVSAAAIRGYSTWKRLQEAKKRAD